jgi:hypothetical protein
MVLRFDAMRALRITSTGLDFNFSSKWWEFHPISCSHQLTEKEDIAFLRDSEIVVPRLLKIDTEWILSKTWGGNVSHEPRGWEVSEVVHPHRNVLGFKPWRCLSRMPTDSARPSRELIWDQLGIPSRYFVRNQWPLILVNIEDYYHFASISDNFGKIINASKSN